MEVREARDGDVEALRDLFVSVYGDDYPYEGFYDTEWLKKSVYDDDTIVLVCENGGHIVATGTMVLNAGDYDDLVGEMGRLVAEHSRRARGAAADIVRELHERTGNRALFMFAEVRTVHRGAQRLSEQFSWAPVGFEPMKYRIADRESVVVYASVKPIARELRRNNPRVIPEAADLARTALRNLDMPVDAIVTAEPDGYPTGRTYSIEHVREQGVTPLLRIERGRVVNREIFGNFTLAHGIFNISDTNTHYIMARDGENVLGGVGYTWDPIDSKVRIFELIDFDDAVKGFLLRKVDEIAREEFHADYQEADVSAYSPRIQRTLERLGYVPVAYCPAMVFEDVERLDVVRMAKINARYELGRMRLLERPARIRELVERGFEDRRIGMEITEAARRTEIFRNLPEGDLYHLARICDMREYPAGATLMREGDDADRICILVEGEAEARSGETVLGALHPGMIFGEMGLVQHTKRSADVALVGPARVIEIDIGRLLNLMESNARLGYTVMSNLAGSLSEKLRAMR